MKLITLLWKNSKHWSRACQETQCWPLTPFRITKGGSDPAIVIACATDRILTKREKCVLPINRASRLGFRTWAPGSRRTWLLLGAVGLGAPVPLSFASVVPLLPPVPLDADTRVVVCTASKAGTLAIFGNHVRFFCTSTM
jgi:hypothetical protein